MHANDEEKILRAQIQPAKEEAAEHQSGLIPDCRQSRIISPLPDAIGRVRNGKNRSTEQNSQCRPKPRLFFQNEVGAVTKLAPEKSALDDFFHERIAGNLPGKLADLVARARLAPGRIKLHSRVGGQREGEKKAR